MSAGDPPPSDPEAFAPTIAPTTAQRPGIATAASGPSTARQVGPVSYQDTVAIGSSAPADGAAGLDDLPLTDPGQYVSEREVARGGMGRIIAAHDRILGRPVALKELLHADAEHAARFRREALITARLQHPAIVPVYQAGRWPSGEPFYAMKLVSGRPLDRVIADAETLADRLALLPSIIAAVDAIAYAHSKRIVHRDLKPANVLVGDFGEIVVIDWGLAKDLDDDSPDTLPGTRGAGPRREAAPPTSDGPALTIAGAVMGTPAYMPPEQARGEAVDERADVFSLGAMLYHVLTGAPPYAAKTATEVIAAAIEGAVEPLASRASEAPADLIAIVARAMAHEPGDRYPTAKALAEELRRFQTGKLVAAHRYSVRERLNRFVRRHRGAVTIGAIAAVAFLVLGTLALRRIVVERDRAEVQRRLAEERRAAAEQVIDYLISDTRTRLGAIGRKDLLAGIGATVRDYYQRLGTGITPDDRERLALALYTLGQAELERGDQTAAEASLEAGRRELEQLLAGADDGPRALDRRRLLASVLIERGRILHTRGDYQHEIEIHQAALDHYQAILRRRPSDRDARLGSAAARDLIADIARNQGRLDEAFAEYRAAMAVRRELVDAAPADAPDREAQADLATSHLKIASTMQARGDTAGALTEYRACEALRARLALDDPENTARTFELAKARMQVADLERDLGAISSAQATYRKALLSLDALLRKDPGNATWRRERGNVLSNWGHSLIDKGDARNATDLLTQALANHQQLLAKDPSNTSWLLDLSRIHLRLADANLWRGQTEPALAAYREAKTIRLALLTKDPKSPLWRRLIAWADAKLGAALLLSGDLEAADEAAVAARDARAALLAASPDQAGLRNELAQAELLLARIAIKRGRGDDATAAVARAIEDADRLVVDDEVNLEWKESLVAALTVSAELTLGRGGGAAALTALDRAVAQARLAEDAAPESAVWAMLAAEARFLRARAIRALPAASPAQRDTADEDLAAAYRTLDTLAEHGHLAADRQGLWTRVKTAHLRGR